MVWGAKQRSSGQLRLCDCPASDWVSWASEIVDSGVLLSLGRSRDGGALSIAYVHNGAKGREWYSDDASFAEGMYELARHLGLSEINPPSAPQAAKPPEGRRAAQKPS